jgi:hypothetical protein
MACSNCAGSCHVSQWDLLGSDGNPARNVQRRCIVMMCLHASELSMERNQTQPNTCHSLQSLTQRSLTRSGVLALPCTRFDMACTSGLFITIALCTPLMPSSAQLPFTAVTLTNLLASCYIKLNIL